MNSTSSLSPPAGHLQRDTALVVDAADRLEDVVKVGRAGAERARFDAAPGFTIAILDMHGADAVAVGGKLFRGHIAPGRSCCRSPS